MTRRSTLSVARARAWRRRWDLQQTRYIGHREERFDQMLAAIAAVVGRRPRVLDLGCGTGSLSERVLRRFPAARVVAVDYDPVTLTLGRVALGTVRGRLRWIETDLNDPSWVRALPRGRFDAAVSSTALHWLEPAALRRLYRQLGSLVRPGGIFLNADVTLFHRSSRRLRRVAKALRHREFLARTGPGESWSEWWHAVARDPALEAPMREHRRRFPRGHTRTRPTDLAGHQAALRRAGFREVEVVWSAWEDRVLAAVR
jgi:SAM-dependent methyltransferase